MGAVVPIATVSASVRCCKDRLLHPIGRGCEHLFGAQLRNSNTRRETKRISALGELCVLQLFADFFRHRQRVMKCRLVQKDRKRIAAKSSYHLMAASELLKLGGRLTEDHVAALVPVFAINERKRIQIDEY